MFLNFLGLRACRDIQNYIFSKHQRIMRFLKYFSPSKSWWPSEKRRSLLRFLAILDSMIGCPNQYTTSIACLYFILIARVPSIRIATEKFRHRSIIVSVLGMLFQFSLTDPIALFCTSLPIISCCTHFPLDFWIIVKNRLHNIIGCFPHRVSLSI